MSKIAYLEPENQNLASISNAYNWQDMRIGASSLKVPTTNPAEYGQVGTTGLYLPEFEDAKDDQLYFETQMSHGYNLGGELLMHIHCLEPIADAGRINWKVYYQIKNVGAAYVMNASVNTGTDLYADGANVAGNHSLSPTHTIASAGLKESCCIFGRIVREHSAGGDTFTGSVFLLSMDIHYKNMKMGSIVEFP